MTPRIMAMRVSPRQIRWTLSLTATAMAAVLLLTGVWSYTSSRFSALDLARSQAVVASRAARRALRVAGGAESENLQEALADLQDEGVRYLGVVNPDGSVAAAAGAAAQAATWLPGEQRAGPHLRLSREGFRVRLEAPFFEGRSRWGRGGRRWADGNFADGGQAPRPGRGLRRLAVELDSGSARALAARARLALVANLVAAALLLGLAAVFWRLSRQAESASAQLARDRQLKALGEMSAVLGHELRNPLASLKGHCQLLLEKLAADHPGRRGAETVLRETVRLEKLSFQILEFARTGTVQPTDEDPVALARAAAEAAGGGSVRVEVDGETRPWPLDRMRMEEVLSNLLRNAIEASPEDKPVELTVTVRQGQALTYEVRDHGEGLPAGEEARIFEPFFTRKTRGTGLGLALARRIVEGHGGQISAHNHSDGGAVFRVSLPWPWPWPWPQRRARGSK
ncbi:MAG: GHKL domain-containing protein [Deltaproteobacteria bacterium]|nr:GHKL domain-containing protein [Deltaproteobacteria bacterium]